MKMENTRISFEVQNDNGFPAEALTFIAKKSVEEFMGLNSSSSTVTDEEIAAELDRRWEHYLQHPETAIPHKQVMEELKALL